MALAPKHSRRPLPVTIVIVFMLVQVAVAALTWRDAAATLGITSPGDYVKLSTIPYSSHELNVLLIFVSYPIIVLCAIIAIAGLYRMRPWAWTGAMLLEGLVLALALFTFLRGETVPMRQFIPVIAVILLNQLPVRRAFGAQAGAND